MFSIYSHNKNIVKLNFDNYMLFLYVYYNLSNKDCVEFYYLFVARVQRYIFSAVFMKEFSNFKDYN